MGEPLDEFIDGLVERNPAEEEFHQAVREVYGDVIDEALADPRLVRAQILERLTEPDRVLIFRVVWENDEGELRTNRAYRVQFNNSIGPYKGGLRFVKGLNLGTLKFLGFEQTLKNALTGLPMGGAKGGADFNPKGKSDAEVMRFCQSMMTELAHYIGEDVDVPAGDIGVGEREIGYLFGQYKRLENRFAGVLTGKGMSFGGSAVRKEATGYGAAYFTALMLDRAGEELAGRRCAVSGAGNVSIFCAEKLLELGAIPITLSDSDGAVHDPDGIDDDKLEFVKRLKLDRRGRIAEYADEYPATTYLEGGKPWEVGCDLAFPCATQNELDADDAQALLDGGCRAVVEGANMPLTEGALDLLRERLPVAPAKAANAGGVAVSGLEQSQNAVRISWSRETVDRQLREIMEEIHEQCVACGKREDGSVDYPAGANRAAFARLSRAMLGHGAV